MIAATDPTDAACPCCLPRRGFIRGLVGLGAAAAAATMDTAQAQPAPQGAGYTGPVIDCHGHVWTPPRVQVKSLDGRCA